MNDRTREFTESLLGVATAMVTPMTADFEVDFGGLAKHIEFQRSQEITLLLPGDDRRVPSLDNV